MENEVISVCQIRTIFSMLRNYQGENIKTDVYSLISDLVDYGIFEDIKEMRSEGKTIEEIHRQINIKHSGRPVAGSKGKEIEISEPRLKEKEESPNEAYVRKIKEGGIPINSPKKEKDNPGHTSKDNPGSPKTEKEIIERVSKKLWEQSDVGLKQGFTKHNELPKDVISSDWDDLNEDIKKSWLSYMIPIDTELNDLYFETNTYKEAEELRMKAKHKLNSKDNPGSPDNPGQRITRKTITTQDIENITSMLENDSSGTRIENISARANISESLLREIDRYYRGWSNVTPLDILEHIQSKDNPGSPSQNKEKDLMEAKIWYDDATEEEITIALESFGWKPYKFRIPTTGGKTIYPVWDKLGDNYGVEFAKNAKQDLIKYVNNLRKSKDNPGSPEHNFNYDYEKYTFIDENEALKFAKKDKPGHEQFKGSKDNVDTYFNVEDTEKFRFAVISHKDKNTVHLFEDSIDQDYIIAQLTGLSIEKVQGREDAPKDNPGSPPQNIDWHAHPGYTHDKYIIRDALDRDKEFLDSIMKRHPNTDTEYELKRIPALIEMINSGKHVMINDGGECQYQNLQKEKDLEEIKEREKEARALAGKAFSEKFKKEREKGKDNPGQEGLSKFVGLANIRKYIDVYERKGGDKSPGALHEVVEQYAFETDPEVIDDILRLHKQGEIPDYIFLVMNASAKNLAMAEKELEYNKAIKARKYEEAAKLKEIKDNPGKSVQAKDTRKDPEADTKLHKERKVLSDSAKATSDKGEVTTIIVGRSGLKKRLKDSDLSNVLEAKQDQEGEAGGYKYKVLKEDVKWQLTKL